MTMRVVSYSCNTSLQYTYNYSYVNWTYQLQVASQLAVLQLQVLDIHVENKPILPSDVTNIICRVYLNFHEINNQLYSYSYNSRNFYLENLLLRQLKGFIRKFSPTKIWSHTVSTLAKATLQRESISEKTLIALKPRPFTPVNFPTSTIDFALPATPLLSRRPLQQLCMYQAGISTAIYFPMVPRLPLFCFISKIAVLIPIIGTILRRVGVIFHQGICPKYYIDLV